MMVLGGMVPMTLLGIAPLYDSIRALTPSCKDSAIRLCKPKLDDSAEGGGFIFLEPVILEPHGYTHV